jgi:two-component system, LuxR family, sensor kinase FixL
LNSTPSSFTLYDNDYKNLFDSAHDLIHFAQLDGSLIYVNHSWIQTLGYTQQEAEGKTIVSFIDEPDKELFQQYQSKIINGAKPAKDDKIIITLKTKPGQLIKAQGFILLQTRDNKPAFTTGIFRDVTKNLENEIKLKLSNERLRQSESDLRQLLIYAPDAVIVIDKNGIIQFWNPKAESVFGWSISEALGQTLTNTIIPPQHRNAHEAGMKRLLTTGEAHVLNKTIEITALNKKGEEFYVSLTISTTRQKDQIAFIAFIRDITVQKQNEWELETKRKELETSNHQLEQFAHVASHDMKEPIRKIKMFTERSLYEFEGTLSAKANQYLEKIYSAANRLSNMVDGVLMYSTLTKSDEVFELLDLNQILNNIESDLELLITEKKATINYTALPAFEGVPFLIYQLFYNLINNSLKFAKKDMPAIIEISGTVIEETGETAPSLNKGTSHVEIIVKDNGIGFLQEFSEKIFQTFARLNSKDKYEGTGLGLALCKNIVMRHKGSIMAIGEEEVGASFKIILPQKQL